MAFRRKMLAFITLLTVSVSATSLELVAATLVITDNGKEYHGEVISAGMNTLTMKLSDTGYEIIPMNTIARVKVDIVNSSPIEGQLVDWSDGEISVRMGDRDITVRGGTVMSVLKVTVPVGGPVPVGRGGPEPVAVQQPVASPEPVAAQEPVAVQEPVASPVPAVAPAEPRPTPSNEPEPANLESAPVTNATM